MKVIVAGSRTITDCSYVDRAMLDVHSAGFTVTEIVSGGARGVDRLGEQWARRNNVPCKRFLPEWERYGKAAGPARNEEMARYADYAVIIWDGKSRGAADMPTRARAHNLRTVVYTVAEQHTS